MSTNFFINNFESSQEQNLMEDLIIESIRFYGQDMYYIPRVINNFDEIYVADDQSSYETPYSVEMYIKSVNGFSGDGNFMSKFGIEIRDQVIFSVARRVFNDEIGRFTSTQLRPNEGDLIYYPLNRKCFQIKYVNQHEMFYPLGKLYTWELTCELFEYSGETLNTGIPEIDDLQVKYDTNMYSYALLDINGNQILDENGDLILIEDSKLGDLPHNAQGNLNIMNEEIQNESDQFIDFTAFDPFSEGKI
jgi:hypothetical protein